MQKSSEILENPKEFMEILSEVQKTLLKSSKDFKFSYETQGDKIKIEVLIQKGSVKQKQEEDEGWISNIGNSTCTWPKGYGITEDTLICIEQRRGTIKEGVASNWEMCWRETDDTPLDIIKFRIIK